MARKTKKPLTPKKEEGTKPTKETPKPMTESEKRRFEEFVTRRQATPLAVKFVTKDGKNGRDAITQDMSYGADNAMAAFSAAAGSVDSDFCCKLLNQAVNASPSAGLETVDHSNAVAATMTGLAPQNELEGLLAAQMSACHNAAMECLRRACVKDQTFEGRKMNMTFADRFMRTFAVQVEALGKYRKGGQQKVVVEHVHVYPGGQAIVGNFNQPPGGRGTPMETTNQPHVSTQSDSKPRPCRFNLAVVKKCSARSKRTGNPCRQPAMANGKCRFHGGKSTGAPVGNKNAWKHGDYSAQAQERRREMRQLLREARQFLAEQDEI
ncbi:MAG: HGGxSTG domain-containing protein [Solidesulfovibrio sp.]|uniref:HGGxSTG domain-containing protein n=1 Tax=Solidesulfovibrio sp. TaxID=2910990 RepID=UPI002B1FCF3E|nr:HGGxSTG domain-containing protein [Solidesulfovibrio sp.]MEA4858328.1 HGGxSTG domain-containing protein [Solidesulfovibrio sp.]